MIKNYDNYIFDFDGTIASLIIDWKSLKSEIDEHCQIYNIEKNKSLNQKIDELKNYVNVFNIIDKYEKPNGVINFDSKKRIIDFIKDLNAYYVISNNLNSTVTSALKRLDIHSSCVQIYGIDDIINSKPSTESYFKMKPYLKDGKSIYIGDRDSDRDFARNCKIDFFDIRE